jgi:hypothetical protein
MVIVNRGPKRIDFCGAWLTEATILVVGPLIEHARPAGTDESELEQMSDPAHLANFAHSNWRSMHGISPLTAMGLEKVAPPATGTVTFSSSAWPGVVTACGAHPLAVPSSEAL